MILYDISLALSFTKSFSDIGNVPELFEHILITVFQDFLLLVCKVASSQVLNWIPVHSVNCTDMTG